MVVKVYNKDINVSIPVARIDDFGQTYSGTPSKGSFAINGTVPTFTNVDDFSENDTINAGYNAGCFGPMTIESGVTVTVSTGATFTVV